MRTKIKTAIKFLERYGQWALVIGAAEGLGAAYSRTLAAKGMNLILVDIKADVLTQLEKELQQNHGVETSKMVLDLADQDAPQLIFSEVTSTNCRLMVYNAAYGPVRPFLSNNPEQLDQHININSRAPLHLCYRFINRYAGKQSAGIILMSSFAGMWGTSLVGPYGATKAFDYNLAEALHYEFKDQNIDVLVCCSGAINTPNYRSTQPQYGWICPKVYEPDFVANATVRQLGRRCFFVPGLVNKFQFFLLSRILSRRTAARLMNQTMKKMYQHLSTRKIPSAL